MKRPVRDSFPSSQWKSLRTTNAIERLNGEFRRRVKTQGSLPSAQAAETILGYAFMPLALVMGVPWKDAVAVGDLLGTRMVLNELIAYSRLGTLKATLDPRTFTIATYALCGFANFSSIGIQIGGIGGLAPSRKSDIARLGLWALLAGSLATFMSATIAGILLG